MTLHTISRKMLRPINLNSPCFRFATSWVRSVPSSHFVRHDPTPAGPIQQGAVQKQNQVDEQATRSQGQSRKCLRRRGIDTLETDLNTNKRKHRTSTAMLFHLCASFIFLFKKKMELFFSETHDIFDHVVHFL